MMACPCDLEVQQCVCLELINGKRVATTPLELMRSRYVAFSLCKVEYLYKTSSDNLKKSLTLQELKESANDVEFVRLEIIDNTDSQVEFKAYFIVDHDLGCLHERSNFVMESGEWRYDTGHLFETVTKSISRNDACPCGSGKKYKKCHL